jgi:hypothetical protein
VSVQSDLFDLREGERLRDEGKARAAAHRALALKTCRGFLESLAKRKGQVTVDDVYRHLPQHAEQLGRAAGSLFKGKNWKCVGYKPSKRISNHARPVGIWEWVDE